MLLYPVRPDFGSEWFFRMTLWRWPLWSVRPRVTQPRIDKPETVYIGGPVALTVTTENASTVRAKLNGVELELLKDEGDGIFAGVVPIFGAVDNGDQLRRTDPCRRSDGVSCRRTNSGLTRG